MRTDLTEEREKSIAKAKGSEKSGLRLFFEFFAAFVFPPLSVFFSVPSARLRPVASVY